MKQKATQRQGGMGMWERCGRLRQSKRQCKRTKEKKWGKGNNKSDIVWESLKIKASNMFIKMILTAI